jgi:hypothetical protein
MEGLASSPLEGVLCTVFFKRSHAKVFEETEKSAHAISAFTGSATPPLQKPCAVKVAREEGFQYEFD